VIGLLCVAWLYFRIFSLLKAGMKQDKLGTVIVITIVAEYLLVAYSDNMLDYLTFNWYFWFVVGTACSIVVARQAPTPVQPLDSGMPSIQTAPMARGDSWVTKRSP
jgi:putative inorganic carbon (HCO3(-)) transporter